ncbi:MAG: 30S ribosomal protein S20 [Gemmataceae bacterium]
MPHTKSAKKNLRKAEKRRLRNRAGKRVLKTYLKRFDAATKGTPEELQLAYNEAAARLDRAATKGLIHRNLAARKKSQMARLLHAKKNPPTATATGK